MNTTIGAFFILHGLVFLDFWDIILGVVIVLGDD